MTKLKGFYEQLSCNISFNNLRIVEYANKKRNIRPTLKKGDKIYFLQKNIRIKRPNSKLDFKKLGLFRITEQIRIVNYRLELPKDFQLYFVFYISILKPAPREVLLAINAQI